MFNLIPALILMLVAGPTGPVADVTVPGVEHKVERSIDTAPNLGAMVRLVLGRLCALDCESTGLQETASLWAEPDVLVHQTTSGDLLPGYLKATPSRAGPLRIQAPAGA